MAVRVRPFAGDDVAFAAAWTEREGWATSPDWFRIYLEHDPDGCLIAEADGAPAGMVTTTRYARTAWIGNLIVRPDFRRDGIGTRLMRAGLDLLAQAGFETVRLEGDPPGMGIYRRLGFRDELESCRFRREPSAAVPGVAHPTPELLTEALLPAVADLDRGAFGDDRGRLLGLFLGIAEAAFLVRRGDDVGGFLMLLGTRTGVQIGPWIATDGEAAEALLVAALDHDRSRAVTVGLPAPNGVGCELLRRYGFAATASSYRMRWGPRRGSGKPRNVFAIVNGALG